MSSSRFISVRANNVASDQTISFAKGFPTLSFTIPAQNGILDPRSIRINGELMVFKGFDAGTDWPVGDQDGAARITMDSRLGIYAMWDQLVIRHDKSKQVCENIQNYNRYMSHYLGLTSSVQDMTGHMNEASLIQPNADAMFYNVVSSGPDTAAGVFPKVKKPKSFSCYLPCGFLMSGQSVNLMESAFGGVTVEIHLSPDSNCLFSRSGAVVNANSEAHYELSKLSLSCEVHDIPQEEMAALQSQTTGEHEFNTITGLYTTINSTNAQIQYALGLRYLQSAFVNFVPATHINTLSNNGLALTQLSQADGSLVDMKSVQFLKGGTNYPLDFTIRDVTEISGNSSIVTAGAASSFRVPDSQLARMLAESVVPEAMVDKTSLSPANLSRVYDLSADGTAGASYKNIKNGGPIYGLGVRLSQFNAGEDFSQEQFGMSLETDLTSDNPIGVYLFFKAKSKLVYGPSGVNIMK
tara:strand:+ start:3101 stop:4501 length:1401 start_codon:yes stop_codon:yes gene_type:complete